MSRWRAPTVSAAVQARRRLGRAPLKALFGRLCGTVPAAAHLPGMTAFGRELALLKVSADGTRLDVADTPANRRAFGDPPGGRIGPGRYPQIRLLSLIACGTRALIDAAWSTVSVGEPLLLDKLVYRGNFHPGMLVKRRVRLYRSCGCSSASEGEPFRRGAAGPAESHDVGSGQVGLDRSSLRGILGADIADVAG